MATRTPLTFDNSNGLTNADADDNLPATLLPGATSDHLPQATAITLIG